MKLESIVNQPVIDAGSFYLRPLRPSDAGLITLFASDARVAANTTTIPHPLPPGSTEAFIERVRAEGRTQDVWAMDASHAGGADLMGVIGLERMDRNQSEVGFWVAPAYWNTGVASAAVSALMAANPQSSQATFACVFQDNPASARVLINCGFEYLGDAEAFSVARNAKVATWTYSRKAN